MITGTRFFYENIRKSAYPDLELLPYEELDKPVRCMCCGEMTTAVTRDAPIKENFTDYEALPYFGESDWMCPYCAFAMRQVILRKIQNFVLFPDGSYCPLKNEKDPPGPKLFNDNVPVPYLLATKNEKSLGEEITDGVMKYSQATKKHVIFKTKVTIDADLIVANTAEGALYIDRKRIIALNESLRKFYDTIRHTEKIPKYSGDMLSPLIGRGNRKELSMILPHLPRELKLLSESDLMGLALINKKVMI